MPAAVVPLRSALANVCTFPGCRYRARLNLDCFYAHKISTGAASILIAEEEVLVAPTTEFEAAPISNDHDVSIPTDPSRQKKVREDDVIPFTDSATEANRRACASTGDHRPLDNGIDEEDEKSVVFSSSCPQVSKEHPAGTDEIQPETTATVSGIEGEVDDHSYLEQSDIGVPGGAQGGRTVTLPLDLAEGASVEEVPVPAKMSPVGGGKAVPAVVVNGNRKGDVGEASSSNAPESAHVPNSPFQSLPPSSEISFDAESFQSDSGAKEDRKSGAFGIGMDGESEIGIGSGDIRGDSSNGGVLIPTSTQPSRSLYRPTLTDATSLRDVAALVDAEGMAAEQEFLEALQAVERGGNDHIVVGGGAADGAAGEFGFGVHVETGDREDKLDVYGTVDNAEIAARAIGSGDTFSVHDGGGEIFFWGGGLGE